VTSLWVDYIANRRHADALVERMYSEFVSVTLAILAYRRGNCTRICVDLMTSMVLRCLMTTLMFGGSDFFFTRPSLSTDDLNGVVVRYADC
jgi:hypothetical protein